MIKAAFVMCNLMISNTLCRNIVSSCRSFSVYNRSMSRVGYSTVFILLAVLTATFSIAQTREPAAALGGKSSAEQAANFAETGNCAQAMPMLKKAIRAVTDREMRKRIGLDGLH